MIIFRVTLWCREGCIYWEHFSVECTCIQSFRKQRRGVTCCRLRLACRAAASFSSCFTLIRTNSCRTFSRASLVSIPAYSICLMASISGQTAPDCQGAKSWVWGSLWGDRLWDMPAHADGGEVREEAGAGPKEISEECILLELMWNKASWLK